jgi:hypothetical protein
MSSVLGLALVARTLNSWAFFVPVGIMTSVSSIPALLRLRRVLGDGYHVDDLQAALREHALSRSEEIAYERAQVSPLSRNIMRGLFGASVGAGLVFANQLRAQPEMSPQQLRYFVALLGSLGTLALSSVSLIGELVRFRLSARLASTSISFWNSPWGARLAKLASIGLERPDRPALGMPLLTEIALGRATDHLFAALPKASRRELAALPETVRRLERDAGALRQRMEQLDDQLAAFERGGRALHDAEREHVAAGLRVARSLASERLAATVAALENIRLDLLRLQMGSAGIESVTASLDAARHIGAQISASVAAQEEVERLLRDTAAPYGAETDDDTPVEGVPATRG